MTSVEKYNWKANIKINIILLKLMGLWPKGDDIYQPGPYMLYSRIIVFLCVACHILPQAANIYFVRNDLTSVVGIVYVIMIEMMAAIKVYFIIQKMKTLKDHVIVLKSDWFQPKNSTQTLIIGRNVAFMKLIFKMFFAVCFSGNAFYMIYPLLDDSVEGKRLPLVAWYPYDVNVWPFYQITYVHQVLSTCYLSMVHLNIDILIAAFNVYAGCQFQMLCDDLRNFVSLERDVNKNLVACIVQHKRILTFVEGCNQFFSWIIFWHLILSGVCIGITMFQLTLVVPFSSEFYSLLTYGVAITIQIFMYCWFGNEVEVKSNLLAYAVFESDWTDLPENVKTCLLFFTMNVLKPVKITTAFGVLQLSVDTFVKILKTAWSYYALLYQLSSPKL
ncbi:hypothetical protein Zmor_007881 [Zophobas morio]|uniref:Odorant receptor n=1 Tax=Zophobas morio TaxID=2755281 RepID=A0AA38IWF2_9CUCU|nr:hypothetical protein Zmor_007881 [Zophobas morio]